jgi:hypothetical protein
MKNRVPGRLVIKHWEGDLVYEIRRANYKSIDGRMLIQVCGRKPCSGHAMALLGEPAMTICFPCSDGFESLRGRTIKVSSYDPDRVGTPEYVNFYLSSHHECQGADVSVSQDGLLRISAKCEDVNYYDGRAKDNWIEVDGCELEYSEQVFEVY